MLNFKNIFSLCFVLAAILSVIFLYDIILLIILSYLIAASLMRVIDLISPKIGSNFAIALVFLSFWGGVMAILSFLAPLAYDQIELLIQTLPKYKLYIQENFVPLLINKIENIDKDILTKVSKLLEQASDKLLGVTFIIMSNIWEYTRGTLHLIVFFILLPIFNFYLIKDGKTLADYALTIKKLIDPRLAVFIEECLQVILEFLKGLINVCLIMSLYYSTFLTFAQTDFSLLLGLLSGFSIAIPFIGMLTSISLATTITIFHFGIDHHLGYVLLIYLFGQGLESYVVTPKIIGGKIGLTPLIMILALLCWGKLFGIIGLFIAIPMTCVLKVAFKNILEASKNQ